MDPVVIGSGSECLRLAPEPDDPTLDYLVADLTLDGLTATKRVYSHYASGWRDLAAFFRGLATDWRCWSGTREWASVESDLRIEARHEYGHVQLRVTLQSLPPDWGNRGWSTTGDLTLEPGEQLSQVAQDVEDMANRTP